MAAPAMRSLKVFLCHAHEDKIFVRDLYKRLVSIGIDVWLDEEKLIAGQDFDLEIQKALSNSDVILVCLSKNSVSKAGYVNKEIRVSLDLLDKQPEGAIYLIPIRIEEVVVPSRLEKIQWVDLFDEMGYEKLVKALDYRARALDLRLVSPLTYSRGINNDSIDALIAAAISVWSADITHDILKEVGQIRRLAYLLNAELGENQNLSKLVLDIDQRASELTKLGTVTSLVQEAFSLDEFLVNYVHALVGSLDISVNLFLDCEGVLVRLSTAAFQRTLRQLFRNSVRAMRDVHNPQISVHTSLIGNNKVEIIFEHNGHGISDIINNDIFVPSIKIKSESSLFLVKYMIEDMGGEIKLLSKSPGRVAFSIVFPVVEK